MTGLQRGNIIGEDLPRTNINAEVNMMCQGYILCSDINIFCYALQLIEITMVIFVIWFSLEHYMRDIADCDNKRLNLSNCPKAKMTTLQR